MPRNLRNNNTVFYKKSEFFLSFFQKKRLFIFLITVFFNRLLSQNTKDIDGFWDCRIEYECSWGWKNSHQSVLLSKDFGSSYKALVFGGELKLSHSLGENWCFEISGQEGCYRKGEMKMREFAGRVYLSGSWLAKGGDNAMWGTGLCCNGKIELQRDISTNSTKAKPVQNNKPDNNNDVSKQDVKLKTGQKFVLKNVLFKISSDEFMPEAYEDLKKLLKLLNENPQSIIRLEGHTDIDGPRFKNKKLSKKRVVQVKKYLTENGISPRRIKLRWYGEKKPLIKYGTPDERKINRRVEVRVLKE